MRLTSQTSQMRLTIQTSQMRLTGMKIWTWGDNFSHMLCTWVKTKYCYHLIWIQIYGINYDRMLRETNSQSWRLLFMRNCLIIDSSSYTELVWCMLQPCKGVKVTGIVTLEVFVCWVLLVSCTVECWWQS